jgi:hypothetical protein
MANLTSKQMENPAVTRMRSLLSKRMDTLMRFLDDGCADLAGNAGSDDIVSQCAMLVFLSEHYDLLRSVIVRGSEDPRKELRLVTNYILFVVGLRTPLDEPGTPAPATPA